MASQIRIQNSYLEDDALINYDLYDYFQLLRILELFLDEKGNLTILPELSLAFPVNDINKVEKRGNGEYIVSVGFFGLYGVSSPLPVFYTEQLIEEAQRGEHAARQFTDLIHKVTYSLLNSAWRRNKIFFRFHEINDDAIHYFLDTFTGLRLYPYPSIVPSTIRKHLLGYAGLFFRHITSSSALRSLITNFISDVSVEINTLVRRVVPVPQDQQWRLGRKCAPTAPYGGPPVLAYLGSEVEDYTGAVQILLSAQTAHAYASLMPGGNRERMLRDILRFFIGDMPEIQINISLRASSVPSSALGCEVGSRLGSDCWLPGNPTDTFKEGRQYVLRGREHFL
ncbi:hypothetical protein A3780_20390 [Kosakonia radicincitans]|uniref:type VI secretion system baseplate subunit TssG n=1 Tax=Kosakonia radicincitans TaxID=283686 RepID=UPI00090413F0|nr:type VI secretion system baseplate subunit TssG [Kosakonia radicincitans]APG19805.1 hypothetical protein A3780_20390 [Kosakonia radicincitans]